MQSRQGAVTVVVGGQAGSEAKGAVTGFLAYEDTDVHHIGVRIGGSQAGHTVYDIEGRAWPLRHVPVGFVNSDADLVIAAGSEIDVDVLVREVVELEAAGHKISNRLYIDPQATVIDQVHKDEEAARDLHARIGSTAKGVGAARAARMLRTARTVGDYYDQSPEELPGVITDTASFLANRLAAGAHVVIEGVQGYQLGLHAGHYPQCTTADTRAVDFLSMAGISPWAWYVSDVRVIVVMRVYPIRVAGNSGPLPGETTWEALGLPEELTTVTKKVRRVGQWDDAWASDAIHANGGPGPNVVIALSMVDQMFPETVGLRPSEWDAPEAESWIRGVELATKTPVMLVGTGPQTMNVYHPEQWW